MADHESDDKPQSDREGFLGTFIIVTIGTFALLASTIVRSAASLSATLAASFGVGLAAGLLAALLRRRDTR